MFEFTEANTVEEEIRQGLFETLVGFSKSEDSLGNLQSKMEESGITHVKLTGLNERKFFTEIIKEGYLGWF